VPKEPTWTAAARLVDLPTAQPQPVFADSGGSESKCLKIRDRSKKVCATGPPSLSQELCNGLISKEKELDDLTLSNGYDGRAGSLSRPRSLQANQSDARATPRA
jgi:hypothetical protein